MEDKDLKKIVQVFLDKNSFHSDLLDASRDLGDFFSKISPISIKDNHLESKDSTHTNLSSGVALSPLDAAICINEYMRTTKYIRGIYDAINDLLVKFKDEKIHLLYAGTGPYATLITPLLHLFDSKRLEISFLDIHQNSLDSVRNILSSLELSSFEKEYICTDATKYNTTSKVHMMITETMRLAFEGEPQVNITLNLLPQLCENGIFIPESVNIYLESSSKKIIEKENTIKSIKDSNFLADIIKLDYKKQWNRDNLIITPSLEITEDQKDGYDLFFGTQIKVYKEHILNENESSLNIPLPLVMEKALKGDILEFSYEFENRPEILYKHIKKDRGSDKIHKALYPTEVSYRYKDSMVLFKEIVSNRSKKDFSNNEIRGDIKKYISWQEFNDIADNTEFIEPKGFIFHTSRSGSSVLTNLLSSLEKNIVLEKPKIIHDILTLSYEEDISIDEIKQRLKSAIKILAQKRFNFEENLYIKFNSWEIANIDMIRELYPDIPIVILYLEPEKILSSHKDEPGIQMVPRLLKGKVFDSIPINTSIEDYHTSVIENIFDYCLLQKDKDDVIFVNYADIKDVFFTKIVSFLKLDLEDDQKELIKYTLDFAPTGKEKINEISVSDKLKDSFNLLENIKVCNDS